MSDLSDSEAPKDPRHFELLESALRPYGEGRYAFAVIGLQTALEVYLELTVVGLVKWREIGSLGDAIVDKLVRNYRFDDGRFQALWYGLTGDDATKVKAKDWWPAYVDHLDLRHRVVHRGHMPTKLETDVGNGVVDRQLASRDPTARLAAIVIERREGVNSPRVLSAGVCSCRVHRRQQDSILVATHQPRVSTSGASCSGGRGVPLAATTPPQPCARVAGIAR